MTLNAEVDPEEVGLDRRRLARIDRHFNRWVDEGRIPGWLAVISRHGSITHVSIGGYRNIEELLPVETDTLWRIYSMTKPISSVAALILWEEGRVELADPISTWIPAFRDARVWKGGSAQHPVTVPAQEPIRLWHLLTHTSGMTYGMNHVHAVDEMHRMRGFDWSDPDIDLTEACERWAEVPLLFEPGTAWNYSVSTDVLGRIIELVSGTTLDVFLRDRVLRPLGMTSTAFAVPASAAERVSVLYEWDPSRHRLQPYRGLGDPGAAPLPYVSGGGGLVSTAGDFQRFATFLLRGGELDGVRLLGERTVRRMTSNHLPGGLDLAVLERPSSGDTSYRGMGFGLGVSVCTDPVPSMWARSRGEYGWGGAASTVWWNDPAEGLAVAFFTQVMPSAAHPVGSQLHQLVQQSLVS